MPNIWMDVDTALPEVPVNVMALMDDSDFKTREESVTFNQAGLDLVWNFVTTAGIHSQTAVTPTDTGGDYDWVIQGNGMYTIEIPLSGGGTINNDAEGFGWFSGFATGILPWVGPIIGFRAAGLNNLLVDNAFSSTRGLTGTSVPAVAAEGAGGLYTRGAGAGQINQTANGSIDANAVSAIAAFFQDFFTVDSGEVSGSEVSGSAILEIAKVVWDRVLTGSTHNDATSAGRRLRQVEAALVHASGVIAAVANGHTFTLDGGAVATADYYVGDRLEITEGTGAGQSRLITAYTAGKVCTLDSNFTTNPNTASLYDVVAADVHVSLSDADLAGGFVAVYTNTTTITLDDAAVATANYYKDTVIIFTHGPGKGQSRQITAYTSGRVCTLFPALTTALDATTGWHITANAGRENAAWDTATGFNTVVPPSVAQFNARTLVAANYFDPTADTVVNVTNVATLTGHTVQTGDSFTRLGAPAGASVSADVAAVKADLPVLPTKNVALAGFPFLMVLSSDHVTGATGLSVTAERSIDGAAFASATNSVVELASGVYKIDLSAADMNGTTIMLKFTAATADARFITIVTQPT